VGKCRVYRAAARGILTCSMRSLPVSSQKVERLVVDGCILVEPGSRTTSANRSVRIAFRSFNLASSAINRGNQAPTNQSFSCAIFDHMKLVPFSLTDRKARGAGPPYRERTRREVDVSAILPASLLKITWQAGRPHSLAILSLEWSTQRSSDPVHYL
jgi:hypothetical protein